MPSLGELAAELVGANLETIVGVSDYSDEPPGLKTVTSIGPYTHFNLEKVLALKPDLVLGSMDGNSKDQILHLRELGIPVVLVQTESFQDIETSIQLVSQSIGAQNIGQNMIHRLQQGFARFKARAQQRAQNKLKDRLKTHLPVKVLLQIGDQPLVVAGGQSFLNAALELIGAKNIYGENQSHYPRPALEDVIQKDPDIIITLALGQDIAPLSRARQRWFQLPQLKAVKSKRVYLLHSDALLRPTPRILEGLSLLEKAIYDQP